MNPDPTKKTVKPTDKKAPAKTVAAEKVAAKKAVAKKLAPNKAGAKKAVAQKPIKPIKATKPPVDLASLPVSPPPALKQKTKLVRDSFTMPQSDFALVDVLKARALNMKHPVKKSELLRAGLQALSALDDMRLLVVLEALEPLKAGRPKKD